MKTTAPSRPQQEETKETMAPRRSRAFVPFVVCSTLLLSFATASAAVRYVDASSASPTPPYTNWTSAARVIQDAVDAAAPGDEIVVTNGLYATGGRAVGTSLLVNRVAVDKPLTLRSVHGPEVTVIQGYQVPGTTNGGGAIRCVYLADGATLSGFTLTNGTGGGVWCESTNALTTNCVVTGNAGLGAWSGTLNKCALIGNTEGGACYGTLNNCTLIGNTGGGAAASTLNNCVLTGNSAYEGGGAAASMLNNCALTGNSAFRGGGAFGSTLNNCVLTGNSAADAGGGAFGGTLNNCTVTGNSAASGGGVARDQSLIQGIDCKLNNCLLYHNTAADGPNYLGGFQPRFNYCCTTPLPEYGDPEYGGVGNISADPQLVSASHLSAFSPCRGAGSPDYACGNDIDGEPWGNPPSIGCDEYHAEALTGPLAVSILAEATNVAVGFPLSFTALIEGRPSLCVWDFDDGALSFDRPYETHRWTTPGDYVVSLWALNESHPDGVSVSVTVHVLESPVHYVALGNPNPIAPYLSWATAATNIQDAVDQAFAGATVLVSNGVYAAGARVAAWRDCMNRVVINKPCIVRSVNGPQLTVIQGYQVPGTTNGDGAIRCVYLADGASLSGFTLTHGATRTNGFWRLEQSGGAVWCEWLSAVVSNCVISGNSAADSGGGAYGGALHNCTLSGNSAWRSGGGAARHWDQACILNNCTLIGNSANDAGGGAIGVTLNNCILTGNSASYGGGADYSSLNNCTLRGNSAMVAGGGAIESWLNNCTLVRNSALAQGGGSYGGWPRNCILYSNTAAEGANYFSGMWRDINYCCTTPMPTNGVGNITNAPLFVDYAGGNLRLQSSSPCINAGNNDYVTSSTDLDGNPRIVGGVVDVGAYENQAPAFNVRYVWQDSPIPAEPYESWASAAHTIQDAVDAALAGDEILVTNGLYAIGGRAVGTNLLVNRVAVDKRLAVRSVNGPEFTIIQGYQVPGTTNGDGAIRCVYLANGAVLAGFTLTKGATQFYNYDEYGRSDSGGGVWCESSNSFVSDCVLAGNSAGWQGGGAYNATLNHCVLSGNSAGWGGGGAFRGTLYNCTLTGNSAAGDGGGAYGRAFSACTLNHCVLTGNSAEHGGGAAGWITLNGCTITGNSAGSEGGGVACGYYNDIVPIRLTNCIVYFNTAPSGPDYYYATLNYCCTTPMPTNGVGNITNAPLFVDYAGGNLRLQSNSPCINAGNNSSLTYYDYNTDSWVTNLFDLDGNPRIVSGTVDIGAYEFQGPGSVVSYAWLQHYGLPTDGSADAIDADADGHTTWQEWRCGTCPTNSLSVLRLLSASPNGTNVTVTWQSVAGVSYFLERSTNLASPFIPLATDIPGQSGTTTYTDTNAATLAPMFYRVGVGN